MAVGTTFVPEVKRNDIVIRALRSCRAIEKGQAPDGNDLRDGVDALNEILREEDNDKTGQKRFLMALSTKYLFLQVGKGLYTVSDGLAADVQEVHSFHYRDTKGCDYPIDFISPLQWESIANKFDGGDPCAVYLQLGRETADNKLHVVPMPRTIGTASVVIGTDTLHYKCVKGHTASADNQPVTGTSYTDYWQEVTSGGVAWVTGTAYTNAAELVYLYKRPLFNFDTLDDDPDVPSGWASYLRWRLAEYLSPEYDVSDTDRAFFVSMYAKAEQRLFPSMHSRTSDYHNKVVYF